MPALLFGSIGAVVDTSEMQRDAYNRAFEQHGLDWSWERADYVEMLRESGGRDRVAAYASERGDDVDAEAVHRTKSEIFRTSMADGGLSARPGVVDAVKRARADGHSVALVTTTSPDNVSAMLSALGSEISESDFDFVLDTSDVDQPKPDPEAYRVAISRLALDASRCVAVEDNVGGVRSAVDAGLTCVAFPNANTAEHDFDGARSTVDRLDYDQLSELL
ncbi:HAD family hydrolase [Ilumatobacter sp.]|uniref:HAD family hydrolase n=1 Tax=Ilumatobacter sp. TaxID=1967498 RepID=UPI003B51CF8D